VAVEMLLGQGIFMLGEEEEEEEERWM